MECLICSTDFLEIPSWKKLFFLKQPDPACVKCKSKFKRADVKDFTTDWAGTQFDGALDSLESVYEYNEWMKQVFQQYKFHKDAGLAAVFADDFRPLQRAKELIVPIPIHPERLKERTFSQVDQLLFAAKVQFEQVLSKIDNSKQTNRSRHERMDAEINFSVISPISGRSILLVDDLYTTGTTLYQAAFVLKEAGAREVKALTLIRA